MSEIVIKPKVEGTGAGTTPLSTPMSGDSLEMNGSYLLGPECNVVQISVAGTEPGSYIELVTDFTNSEKRIVADVPVLFDEMMYANGDLKITGTVMFYWDGLALTDTFDSEVAIINYGTFEFAESKTIKLSELASIDITRDCHVTIRAVGGGAGYYSWQTQSTDGDGDTHYYNQSNTGGSAGGVEVEFVHIANDPDKTIEFVSGAIGVNGSQGGQSAGDGGDSTLAIDGIAVSTDIAGGAYSSSARTPTISDLFPLLASQGFTNTRSKAPGAPGENVEINGETHRGTPATAYSSGLGKPKNHHSCGGTSATILADLGVGFGRGANKFDQNYPTAATPGGIQIVIRPATDEEVQRQIVLNS